MSSPWHPPPAIPRAEATSPQCKMFRETKGCSLVLLLSSRESCTRKRHFEAAPHILHLGPVPKAQLLPATQLPSSAGAEVACPEIPLACHISSKLSHKKNPSSPQAKQLVKNGVRQMSPPMSDGRMPQPRSLPLLMAWLSDASTKISCKFISH